MELILKTSQWHIVPENIRAESRSNITAAILPAKLLKEPAVKARLSEILGRKHWMCSGTCHKIKGQGARLPRRCSYIRTVFKAAIVPGCEESNSEHSGQRTCPCVDRSVRCCDNARAGGSGTLGRRRWPGPRENGQKSRRASWGKCYLSWELKGEYKLARWRGEGRLFLAEKIALQGTQGWERRGVIRRERLNRDED